MRGKRSRTEARAHPGFDACERGVERGGIRTAGLRHVRTTTAATANLLSDAADELARLDLVGLVLGDSGDQQHLVAGFNRSKHDHRRLQFVLELIDGIAKRARIGAVHARRKHLHTVDLTGRAREVPALPAREPALELLHFLFELFRALDQLLDLVLEVLTPCTHEPADIAQERVTRVSPGNGTLASQRLNAAHARRDARFTNDLEESNVARA